MLTSALALADDHTAHDSGGVLALAVVNTVWWRWSEEPIDKLTSYEQLVGLVSDAHPQLDRAGLLARAAQRPRVAGAALAQALALREDLFALFSDVVAGAVPALDPLNDALADAAPHLRVAADAQALLTTTWDDPSDVYRPIWQIAVSAAALITGQWRDRLRQCPGERCGWVFLDLTRNRSRRWCDPAECGNRERVRAHYRRSHAG